MIRSLTHNRGKSWDRKEGTLELPGKSRPVPRVSFRQTSVALSLVELVKGRKHMPWRYSKPLGQIGPENNSVKTPGLLSGRFLFTNRQIHRVPGANQTLQPLPLSRLRRGRRGGRSGIPSALQNCSHSQRRTCLAVRPKNSLGASERQSSPVDGLAPRYLYINKHGVY